MKTENSIYTPQVIGYLNTVDSDQVNQNAQTAFMGIQTAGGVINSFLQSILPYTSGTAQTMAQANLQAAQNQQQYMQQQVTQSRDINTQKEQQRKNIIKGVTIGAISLAAIGTVYVGYRLFKKKK